VPWPASIPEEMIMTAVWKKPLSTEILNSICQKGLSAGLGISFSACGDDRMEARLSAENR